MVILISNSKLQQLASLTARNCHEEAYQIGASILGQSELAEMFSRIERRRRQLGYLSQTLQEERRSAYDEMMSYARAHMSAADFHQFYMLF